MRVLVSVGVCVLFAGCVPTGGIPTARLPASTSTLDVPDTEATVFGDLRGYALEGVPIQGDDAREAVEAALRARAAELRARAVADPSAPAFEGTIAIGLDAALPGDALTATVAAAVAAGFERPWLLVADRAGERRSVRLALPEVSESDAARSGAPSNEGGTLANPRVTLDPAAGVTVRVHDRVVDTGDGLLLACDPAPCDGPAGSAWPWVELNRLARRVKLDHPRDRAAMLTFSPDVAVQDVVHALDALRDDGVVSSGARELFPVVQLVDPRSRP